jgi:hypothetical protein
MRLHPHLASPFEGEEFYTERRLSWHLQLVAIILLFCYNLGKSFQDSLS